MYRIHLHLMTLGLAVGACTPTHELTAPAPPVSDARVACDAGDAAACFTLAQSRRAHGETSARYMPLLQRACTAGDIRSCYVVGSAQLADRPRAAVDALGFACKRGHAKSCNQLALCYHKGNCPVANDRARIRIKMTLFDRGCSLGYAEACRHLAKLHPQADEAGAFEHRACELGDAVACESIGFRLASKSEMHFGSAVPYFEKACKAKLGSSCEYLGASLLYGHGDVSDRSKGLALLTRACELSQPSSCLHLADALAAESVADETRVTSLYARACKLGSATGCMQLTRTAAQHLSTIDYEQAADVLEKACDRGVNRACRALAVQLQRGWGTEADPALAATLLATGCARGHQDSCVSLANALQSGVGVVTDARRAASLYRRACQAQHMTGCYNLAAMLASGRGLRKDLKAAATLYERACQANHATACYNFAHQTQVRDQKRALELFEKACGLGERAACHTIGRYHLTGAKSERGRAVPYLALACDQGSLGACHDLAVAHHYGQGTPRAPQKAKPLYEKACRGGKGLACEQLVQLAATSAADAR